MTRSSPAQSRPRSARGRATVAATAVLTCAAGSLVAGGAVVSSAAAASTPSRLPAHDGSRLVAAWQASQRLALLQAGGIEVGAQRVHSSRTSNGQMPIPEFASLSPIGDLDGDGRPDVLDQRMSGLDNVAGHVGFTLHDARTGKRRWAFRLPTPAYSDSFALPLSIAKGRPGLMTYTEYGVANPDNSHTDIGILRGFDGRTGRQLWSRTFTGTETDSDTWSHVPRFTAVLGMGKRHPADIAMTLEDEPGANQSTSTLLVLSGATGKTVTVGTPVTRSANFDFPTYTAAGGDLDGDHHDDLILTDPDTFVRAVRSNDSTIWTSAQVPGSFAQVQSVGPYSHRSSPDLALTWSEPLGDAHLALLQGSSGHVIWSRAMANSLEPYVLGHAGKNLKPAVGFYFNDFSATSNQTTDVVDFDAIGVDGADIYDKSKSLTLSHASVTSQGGSDYLATLGDVQPDGSREAILQLGVSAGASQKYFEGLIDGRTGKVRDLGAVFPSGPDVAVQFSAGGLRSGRGDDLLDAVVSHGQAMVIAVNGRTVKRYYRRSVPGFTHETDAWVTGSTPLRGERCSDVLLGAATLKAGRLAVLSGSGKPLWSESFTNRTVTGGTIKHYRAPRHFCA